MPLIVCSKCKCIENTHLVNKKRLERKVDHNSKVTDGVKEEFYPCMDLRDMSGYDNEDFFLDGEIYKKSDEIKILCSECNTGVWHNEFDKVTASDEIIEMSKFSKYGYITPYDQDSQALEYDVKANLPDVKYYGVGYISNVQYGYIHKLFRKVYGEHMVGSIVNNLIEIINDLTPGVDTLNEYVKAHNFMLIHEVFIEEKDNFHLSLQGDIKDGDFNWCDKRDVCLLLLDSIVDMSKAKGLIRTILLYHNESEGILNKHIMEYKSHKRLPSKTIGKPHWKFTQSLSDKNAKLKVAEEKRLRKLNKKRLGK